MDGESTVRVPAMAPKKVHLVRALIMDNNQFMGPQDF